MPVSQAPNSNLWTVPINVYEEGKRGKREKSVHPWSPTPAEMGSDFSPQGEEQQLTHLAPTLCEVLEGRRVFGTWVGRSHPKAVKRGEGVLGATHTQVLSS